MSTTFNVFPLKKEVPTFQEVLDLSTEKLDGFLRDFQINLSGKIEVKLLTKESDVEQKFDLNSLAKWSNDLYAWFSISSVNGGTDSYYWELSDDEKSDNLEEFLNRNLDENRKTLIKNCLENETQWNFRRSAGQLAVTTIAYGFIASSFAELTDGIISSEDGGWDYQIFPATAEEFDAIYFRPEKAISEDKRKWAENCIENLS